jgi:nucleotide-binding universal stress UspA family protein
MLKDLVAHHKVRTRTVVATGEAAPEILRLAHEEHADLIVIASHGLAGWRRLVFGSVTEKVLRQATCPVLTIMAPPEAEGPH